MPLLVLSIAWALVVAGLLARAITQYRYYPIIGPSSLRPGTDAPSVTVIVPARNEEQNIRRCLDGLRSQDYPADRLRVIVVDDNSDDQTAGIVESVVLLDNRVQLVKAGPLPLGWVGKPHACWQAASAADAEWLCFIDADTTAHPPLIRTALLEARERGLELLSLQPFQELVTPWERLILPSAFFLIAFTQDLRRTSDPSCPQAAVNGQFLLVRRSAYMSVGGHAAVRDAVAEDSALAAALKAGGHRIGVVGTEALLHTRMYTSLGPLWDGTARQAATLLGGTAGLAAAGAGALALAATSLVLPGWAAATLYSSGAGRATIAALTFALAGSLAMFGTHIGAARYFRIPFWYGLLFPLGYLLGAGVCGYGVWQQCRGQVRWKGRRYTSPGEVTAAAVAVRVVKDLPTQV